MKWDEQVQRLLRKAAMDESVMKLLAGSASVDDEIIGFHAQQAAEKYLKALLSHLRIPFPRTHDLRTLLDILEAAGLTVDAEIQEIPRLLPYAVEWRYDDAPSDQSGTLDRNWMAARIAALSAWVEGVIEARPGKP